ncbi:MAG TPA: SCP2 sterol-binding domain-containing protein [Gammaproteobacteria bacterium]
MTQPQSAPPMQWHKRLPGYLLRPFGLLPGGLTQPTFITLCNRIFAAALAAGELDFLEQRTVRVDVRDAGIVLTLGGQSRRLVGHSAARRGDVRISGDTFDFLLLVSRREDPDTLFFQRRLRIEGDTELGLHVKNFLDAWEPPVGVRALQRVAATLLERLPR